MKNNKVLSSIKYLFTVLVVFAAILIPHTKSFAVNNKANNIFIGDSRTVLMYHAVNTYDQKSRLEIKEYDQNGDYWCAKGATEFNYMRDEAIPSMEPYIKKGTNIFILFGVNNDNNIKKIDDYAELLKEKSNEWKKLGANVFYVSVNPVNDKTVWHTDTMGYCNQWIDEWNKAAINTFNWENMTYIDTNSNIGQDLETTDGVHYNSKSSILIYNYLLNYAKQLHSTNN